MAATGSNLGGWAGVLQGRSSAVCWPCRGVAAARPARQSKSPVTQSQHAHLCLCAPPSIGPSTTMPAAFVAGCIHAAVGSNALHDTAQVLSLGRRAAITRARLHYAIGTRCSADHTRAWLWPLSIACREGRSPFCLSLFLEALFPMIPVACGLDAISTSDVCFCSLC